VTIARVVPQLIKLGHVEQVGIGVDIDPEQRIERRLGLRGVVILAVRPDGPAAIAGVKGLRRTLNGLELGDVIVGLDEKPVNDYDDLYSILDAKKAGDQIRVTVTRNGRERIELSMKVVTLI